MTKERERDEPRCLSWLTERTVFAFAHYSLVYCLITSSYLREYGMATKFVINLVGGIILGNSLILSFCTTFSFFFDFSLIQLID